MFCTVVFAGGHALQVKLRKTKASKSDFFHKDQMRFLVLDGLCLSWFSVQKHVQQVEARAVCI